MPLTTFLPVIIISIVFGYFVASYMAKSDKTDKATLYQKGLREGEEERTTLKEKMQASQQKLAELGKERELERQAAASLRAEIEELKSGAPTGGGMDEATLQALKTAFEEKTAELLQAEQTANEGFRIRASEQIATLESRVAAAEAARAQALEEAEQARQDVSAQASAQATLADLSEPNGVPAISGYTEEEVAARIADAVNQVRTSEAQAIANKQLELATAAQELATARLELQVAREQLESASGQVKQGEETQASSNDAIAAVNTELLRLNSALQDAQAEIAGLQAAREAAEAQLAAQTAQADAQLAERTAQADAQLAEQVAQTEAENAKADEQIAKNLALETRVAELEASLAQAEANGSSLKADSQLSRDEIGEWRRLYEEAEAKNQELEANTARQLQEASQLSLQAVQEAREYAALELADALASRDKAHEENLQQALQAAAAQIPAPQSEELNAMRELVARMEGRLGDIAQSQNGQLASLTQELNSMRQIANLSRAVCEGALRQAAHTENLRAQFEAAARTFLEGQTTFTSELLAPVKQLQAALENTAVAANVEVAPAGGIEALQQAVETQAPAEALAKA